MENHDHEARVAGSGAAYLYASPIFGLAPAAAELALNSGAAGFEFVGRRLKRDAKLVEDLIVGLPTGDAFAVCSDYYRQTLVDYAEAFSRNLEDATGFVGRSRDAIRKEAGSIVDDLASQTIAP